MKCSIILTANAGVLLTVGDKELLIDALHNVKVPVFSAVPTEVLGAVWDRYQSKAPDLVLATHTHFDHVSQPLWTKARRRWPLSTFIAPVAYLGGTVVLNGQRQTVSLPGITVDAMRLPHDGNKYKLLFHYGYFLDIGGFTVLYPGDCSVAATGMLDSLIDGRHVDLALLNFPWAVLSASRRYVMESIAPSHLMLLHLPFLHDDSEGYRKAAGRAAAKMASMDVRLLSDPLQEEVIE